MLRLLQYFALILCMFVLAGCGSKREYKTMLPTDPRYIAAQEVKLKVRELADQLLASLPNDALAGLWRCPHLLSIRTTSIPAVRSAVIWLKD